MVTSAECGGLHLCMVRELIEASLPTPTVPRLCAGQAPPDSTSPRCGCVPLSVGSRNYGYLFSSVIPPQQRDSTETSQVPVQCVRACLGSLTPRDSDPPRNSGESNAAFSQWKNLGIPEQVRLSALNRPAHTRPCQRLTAVLTDDSP